MVEVTDTGALKTWLQALLPSLCEADPGPLSQYVIALLKKKKTMDDLKVVCLEQLEVFLQDNTTTFVDQLFESLTNKSYLPVEEEVPKPVEAQLSNESSASKAESGKTSRKDSKSHASISKSSKQPSRRHREKSRSRSRSRSRDRSHRYGDSRRRKSRSSPRETVSSKKADSPKPIETTTSSVKAVKARCIDYDERGFCVRGDMCPFDHGANPVVATDPSMLPVGYPMSHAAGIIPTVMTPGLNVGVPLLAPGGAPIQQVSPIKMTPQSLSPGMQPRFRHKFGNQRSGPYERQQRHSVPPNSNIVSVPMVQNPEEDRPTHRPAPINFHDYDRPGNYSQAATPLDGRLGWSKEPVGDLREKLNRPRIGGPGPPPRRVQNDYGACAVLLQKVPRELNNVGHLHEHFEQFGTILNVQICYEGHPNDALIEFSDPSEAEAAFRSPNPILNNRFIRIYLHEPRHGQSSSFKPPPSAPRRHFEPERGTYGNGTPVEEEELPDYDEMDDVLIGEEEDLPSLRPEKTFVIPVFSDDDSDREEAGKKQEPEDVEREQSDRTVIVNSVSKQQEDSTPLQRAVSTTSSSEGSTSNREVVLPAKPQQQPVSARQQRFLNYTRQLKSLLDQFETSTDPGEKLALQVTIKQLNSRLAQLDSNLTGATSWSSSSSSSWSSVRPSAPRPRPRGPPPVAPEKQAEIDQLRGKMLDLEMEMYKKQELNEETVPLRKEMMELKRQLLELETGKRPITQPSAGFPRLPMQRPPAPISLPTRAQTKLDKRPRVVYVTGHSPSESLDLKRLFTMANFQLESFEKGLLEDNTAVAMVTFKTRDQAEMAVRVVNKFRGKLLELTFTKPEILPSEPAKTAPTTTTPVPAEKPAEVVVTQEEVPVEPSLS